MARWQWNGLHDVFDPWAGEVDEEDRRAVLAVLAQLLDAADIDLGARVEGLTMARIVTAGRWSVQFVRVEQFHTFNLVAICPA